MWAIVIPTRNSEDTIGELLESCANQPDINIDSIFVIDNFSEDRTFDIVANKQKCHPKLQIVFERLGPERSEQRNHGIRNTNSKYVAYIDSDMLLSHGLLREVEEMFNSGYDAVKVPEYIFGDGVISAARHFERLCYENTSIDSPRFFKRRVFDDVGYFKEGIPGAEDWEFDNRLYRNKSISVGFLDRKLPSNLSLGGGLVAGRYSLLHNEKSIGLINFLGKKAYYSRACHELLKDLPHDSSIRDNFKIFYRLKLLRNMFRFCRFNNAIRYLIILISLRASHYFVFVSQYRRH